MLQKNFGYFAELPRMAKRSIYSQPVEVDACLLEMK